MVVSCLIPLKNQQKRVFILDNAMLVKLYGKEPEGKKRYSPAKIRGTKFNVISGKPDMNRMSTSYVERQNLIMRMQMRRFTKLNIGFSKKFENLCHAVSIHFMYYNFARIHKTLRVTPAMEAGIDSHLWSMEEIADLAD